MDRTLAEVQAEYQITLPITKSQRPKTKKYDRILSLHPYFQNGRFYYNEKNKAHADTQLGISQLLAIEPGYKGHDDYPDAKKGCTQALEKYLYPPDGGRFLTGKMKSLNRQP